MMTHLQMWNIFKISLAYFFWGTNITSNDQSICNRRK